MAPQQTFNFGYILHRADKDHLGLDKNHKGA